MCARHGSTASAPRADAGRRHAGRRAGAANQEIAGLHLGYGTRKRHVSHLLTKLACRDRAQLVMYAYESGHAVVRGAG
jgi:hypothetical protein